MRGLTSQELKTRMDGSCQSAESLESHPAGMGWEVAGSKRLLAKRKEREGLWQRGESWEREYEHAPWWGERKVGGGGSRGGPNYKSRLSRVVNELYC